MERRITATLRGVVLGALVSAVACTPARSDVVSWNRVRLDALRDRLKKIAGSLPPPGEAGKFAGRPPIDPLPHGAGGLEVSNNADVLLVEELGGTPAAGARLPSWHLRHVLGVMDPTDANATARAERDAAFRDEVKHVLALRYVVAVRITESNAEAFVADLATGGIRTTVTLPLAASDVQTQRQLWRALAAATGGTFDDSL